MFWSSVLLACAGSPAAPTAPTDAVPVEAPAEPATDAAAPAERPGTAPPPEEPVEEPTDDAPATDAPGGDGASCLSNDDCTSGICEGEGCTDDQPGTCVEARMRACTRDLRQFCDCDGQTFSGSSTCPGRRFASRGPCE